MTFGESISTCFRKYVDFNGRASRSEFWFFTLFTTIVAIVLMPLDVAVFPYNNWGPIGSAWSLATFFPSIAVGARRLHDSNYSGWLQLISITIIGLIPLLIWLIQKGQIEDNRYGRNPIQNNSDFSGNFPKI